MKNDPITSCLSILTETRIDPFDLLPRRNLVEKLIELVFAGAPAEPPLVAAAMSELAAALKQEDVSDLKVVVLGGGSGLSNIIGGDSCNPAWPDEPFSGIKKIFPHATAIVCVTDDGGSTGEMLKDLPLIGLGDLRRVMLSSIQEKRLEQRYQLTGSQCQQTAEVLHRLFNARFSERPRGASELLTQIGVNLDVLAEDLARELQALIELFFDDFRVFQLLSRPQCVGNLLLATSIYQQAGDGLRVNDDQLLAGLASLAEIIGANAGAVLPCTTTPARLNVLYGNGVMVSGESKAGGGWRNSPVDRVFVEFADSPVVPAEVNRLLTEADIIVMAPGSLYTSLLPILQTPDLAEIIRNNDKALKILVANLWAQKGETELVSDDPKRRFQVSDLIRAYHRNIPGGVKGLFNQVLLLGLQDIPGSILQNYAVEEKVPIYLDRGRVWEMGFVPIEARIFSELALQDGKIQHDPASLAQALKIIWGARDRLDEAAPSQLPSAPAITHVVRRVSYSPYQRLQLFAEEVKGWQLEPEIEDMALDIFWRHGDIRLDHLDRIRGIDLINRDQWQDSPKWDNVISFYDEISGNLKILDEAKTDQDRFEFAFLVALGQSLLGNFASSRRLKEVEDNGERFGQVLELTLTPLAGRRCYLNHKDLDRFLRLVKMNPTADDAVYTRLVNHGEGFTPPGMLMGLIYAWYLDNRFASNIEYKMAILAIPVSSLISEQVRTLRRRQQTISFFRKIIFRHTAGVYDERF